MLNVLNFQSLIATKTARICFAAEDAPIIEFGLRRAQGVDGGLSSARAANIGECAGTSNLHAGERFGIPVSGTQAHSTLDAPTRLNAHVIVDGCRAIDLKSGDISGALDEMKRAVAVLFKGSDL